jgi:hypothetical protein
MSLLPRLPFFVVALAVLTACATPPSPADEAVDSPGQRVEVGPPAAVPGPRLAVIVVFDQLRADHLARFAPRFLPPTGPQGEPGGFRYLMESGAWYPYAEHRQLQCMTCPGHANISTGAYPYRHGIALNSWYEGDKEMYCLGDPDAHIVGLSDPERSYGVSLANLKGPVFADALALGGQDAKVVGVSLKDRGSLLLAGHDPEAAIWFDGKQNGWVTTSAVAETLPAWVLDLNKRLAARKGEKLEYAIEGPGVGLSDPVDDGFRWEFTVGEKKATYGPFGDEVVVDAAIAAIDAESLGADGVVDLLGVSFSALDKVGHGVGPNHRVFEEMMVSADRNLAKLLAALDEKVGLENVVIAVTGDHGVAPLPTWSQLHALPADGLDERKLAAELEVALVARFGAVEGHKWVHRVMRMNVYLNDAAGEAKGVSMADVRAATAAHFRGMKGFAHVFTAEDVERRSLPAGRFELQILRQYRRGRSGDVVLIPEPFYISGGAPANHMTGYTYDTHVPLLLGGFGVRPGVYAQSAEVVDIVPTLSYLSRVLPPALAEGRVLHEALAP